MCRHAARALGCLFAAVLAVVVATSPSAADEARQLRIVKQPGLGYLQLIVMREQKLLVGMIKTVPASWRDYAVEPLFALPGS